jgi:uncharacterized protein (DUF362 family)
MSQLQPNNKQNIIALAQTARTSYPLSTDADGLELLRQDITLVLRLAKIGDVENPFGVNIQPGQSVVIKPNWVREDDGSWADALITHSSLIAVTISLVQQTLQGRGVITIADAPIQGADWERLLAFNRINEYLDALRQPGWLPVDIIDLRMVRTRFDRLGKRTLLDETPGDPLGYCLIDLKDKSALEPISSDSSLFEVSGYDQKATINSHAPGKHQYLISKTVLSADVIINMPKLKTHKKAGMTCCLKNMVGINGRKEYLPHHRRGGAEQGGDEYPGRGIYNKMERNVIEALASMPKPIGKVILWVGVAFKRVLRTLTKMPTHKTTNANGQHFDIGEGSWYGNDTVWRTVNDLNKILIFADKNGILKPARQRVQINLVDAIIAGEGEGPLEPTAKGLGCIMAGLDAVACDAAACWLMGFDHNKIPALRGSLADGKYPLSDSSYHDMTVSSNKPEWNSKICQLPKSNFNFTPPKGWGVVCL